MKRRRHATFDPLRHRRRQGVADNRLGFLQDAAQMIRSLETLRINLVNVFRPGRTRREPAARGRHFQPADGSAVARRLGKDSLDFFARQFGDLDLLRREFRQKFLLIRSGWRLDKVIAGSPNSRVRSR